MLISDVRDIRNYFASALINREFTRDRNGGRVLELLGASFVANDDHIFGKVNHDYVNDELTWYNSQSTNVNDLRIPVPTAWESTANPYGEINSNYGHLIYSDKYYEQYQHVLNELVTNESTRRAQMVYNRPSIWVEYNENGKNDFICTNAVTYYIRDNKMHACVQMRSNDCWAGYRNDFAWQKHVLIQLVNDYNDRLRCSVTVGNIYWQVMNLHMYERNFYLIDHFLITGESHISKSDYKEKYPPSIWS